MKNSLLKNYKNLIPKDFLQVFSFDMLSKVFTMILSILLIRILDVQQYAEYVKFSMLSQFILGVFGTGVALSFIRYSAELFSKEKSQLVVGLHFFSSFFLIILFVFSNFFISKISQIYSADKNIIIIALLYGFTLSLLKLNQYYFQSKEVYTKAGILDNFNNIVLFVFLIVVFFLMSNVKIEVILYSYLLSGFITMVIGIMSIYKENYKINFSESINDFKKMLKESIWLIIYALLLNLFNQLDVIMLSNMTSNQHVAIYGIAYKYYMLLLTLLPSIQSVLRVRTAKKEYSDVKEKRGDFAINWIKKISKITIPFCILIILLSVYFMPLLNGTEYNESILPFKILVIGVGISYIFAPNVQLMTSAKKYKTLCFLAFISLLFNFITNYLFIPLWGVNAVAITTVVSQGILNIGSTIIIILDSKKGNLNEVN